MAWTFSTIHFTVISHQLGDEVVAAGPAVRLLGHLGPRAAPPSQHGSSPWPVGPAGKEGTRQCCAGCARGAAHLQRQVAVCRHTSSGRHLACHRMSCCVQEPRMHGLVGNLMCLRAHALRRCTPGCTPSCIIKNGCSGHLCLALAGSEVTAAAVQNAPYAFCSRRQPAWTTIVQSAWLTSAHIEPACTLMGEAPPCGTAGRSAAVQRRR